jgi:poly(hydroxyalkanoate) depolymerase family esterase
MRRWSLKASLAQLRRTLRETLPLLDFAAPPAGIPAPPSATKAAPKTDFAGLAMTIHAPPGLAAGAKLVVLLHGCGQDPAVFARETGWLALAQRERFVLLLPGQTASRNAQLCFNWFNPEDIGQGSGEAAAICAMTRHALALHRCDPAQVFVAGLSAGGAMAACLLAAFPHVYRAGAVVAGLPAGAARGMVGAMTRMAGHGADLSAQAWADRARALSPPRETGPWPRLLVWHGTQDNVVAPSNGRALAAQFCALHGMSAEAGIATTADGVDRLQWRSIRGDVIVELVLQNDCGHGYPEQTATGADPFVIAGRYSVTSEIYRFWI